MKKHLREPLTRKRKYNIKDYKYIIFDGIDLTLNNSLYRKSGGNYYTNDLRSNPSNRFTVHLMVDTTNLPIGSIIFKCPGVTLSWLPGLKVNTSSTISIALGVHPVTIQAIGSTVALYISGVLRTTSSFTNVTDAISIPAPLVTTTQDRIAWEPLEDIDEYKITINALTSFTQKALSLSLDKLDTSVSNTVLIQGRSNGTDYQGTTIVIPPIFRKEVRVDNPRYSIPGVVLDSAIYLNANNIVNTDWGIYEVNNQLSFSEDYILPNADIDVSVLGLESILIQVIPPIDYCNSFTVVIEELLSGLWEPINNSPFTLLNNYEIYLPLNTYLNSELRVRVSSFYAGISSLSNDILVNIQTNDALLSGQSLPATTNFISTINS
jgi:hypothetical protein